MDSTNLPQPPTDEHVTVVLKKPTRNKVIAKVLILIVLSGVGGYVFARDGAQKYEKGRELTREKYLERYEQYKGTLLNAKQYDNLPLATVCMLMVVAFLFGSYELIALMIGFIIGKLIIR